MMKKIFVLVPILLFASVAFAQIHSDEMQMYTKLFGMPKKDIIAEFVKIEGTKHDQFWQLYDQYESSRMQLGEKRFEVLNKYVRNYSSLTEAETDAIMRDIIELTTSQDKLIAQYYQKIKKKVGVTIAAQFYQIEWYLQSEIRTNILEHIPTLTQFENKK